MIYSTIVLAQIAEGATAGPEPGGIVIVGFLFVVLVLALLASVTSIMGAWFSKQAANNAAKAAVAAESAAEALSKSAGPSNTSAELSTQLEDDPALMAVVAATVHTVFADRPHRVVSIRSSGPGWAQEGRRQIFSSHRVR